MPYVIAEPCSTCKDASCVAVCPMDIIHPGVVERDGKRYDQYFIQADDCIDCGLCESQCPVNAIYEETALPEPWKHYAEINAAFYQKLL